MNGNNINSSIIIGIAIIIAGFILAQSIVPISTSAEKIKSSIEMQTKNAAIDGCYQAARIQYVTATGETIETPEDTWVQNCMTAKGLK